MTDPASRGSTRAPSTTRSPRAEAARARVQNDNYASDPTFTRFDDVTLN